MPDRKPSAPPFDWLETRRNPALAATERERRATMYRVELEERAGLLHRLGHGKEHARARLVANLGWDFPDGKSPVAASAVDAIVDRVFGQASAGRSIPRNKGGTR
jgi:hypothetical protein